MTDPLFRVRLRYKGRVQGVGFRATVRAAARRFGAVGWVRNEADGSVLAEVQGTRAVIEACLSGVADAMSRNIHSTDRSSIDPEPTETEFRIVS